MLGAAHRAGCLCCPGKCSRSSGPVPYSKQLHDHHASHSQTIQYRQCTVLWEQEHSISGLKEEGWKCWGALSAQCPLHHPTSTVQHHQDAHFRKRAFSSTCFTATEVEELLCLYSFPHPGKSGWKTEPINCIKTEQQHKFNYLKTV